MFSLPSLMQSKRKYIIIFLVSLPTLSNPDREHGKEAVLSAHEHAESRILLFAMSGDYCSYGDIERREVCANCKTDKKIAKITKHAYSSFNSCS